MTKRIFVAGHKGMVGSAIMRQLADQPGIELVAASRAELDLGNQAAVANFFACHAIDEVYLCAAKVGGIHANDTYPADFIYDNLMLECNVIHQAHAHGVNKLLFLGSSCIYPRLAAQPMKEEALLTGALEPTNEPYAIAKIAGIKLCESYNRQHGTDYRSVMPTNLYGPGDNFHPQNSHVIPALLRRFHEAVANNASSVTNWGTGSALREFLHVDDMAAASVHVMNLPREQYATVTEPRLSHINVGTGSDCSIRELVETVAEVTGFHGDIAWDTSKPDGAPRKLMDSSKLNSLGWKPKYDLKSGLQHAYTWYLENITDARH
ncbi:GDP-L-fucose synthase [Seongchinamella unica]|uniref:GDP-L-fucose synthase n=1 Tax=Seongchinamella unica TaxID=2547392 RepID=A0A4V2ZX45_9GAMM|nr:GDP-L-fucose synthase [Seongchinamella unica]TDG12893.1 GDP-L-fucose synthase [Seongchinamella unica]